MRQFILDRPVEPGGRVTLEDADYRYLAQVLRLRAGDTVEARLPDGSLATLIIDKIDSRAKTVRLSFPSGGQGVSAEVSEPAADVAGRTARDALAGLSMPPLPDMPPDFPGIVLFQWLIKGPKMDQVIRQATEAGVAAIVPVLGERCVAREGEGDSATRAARWARIVREARQQSGSPVSTVVSPPIAAPEIPGVWLGFSEGLRARALVLTEAPLARKTLHGYLDTGADIVALAVGPEGGMSAGELDGLDRAGFLAVHFRTNILRAETAAIYGIAAVQSAVTESEKWQSKE
jgi:16S rRNA (uracil1498-N3)-methyltransferase